MSVIGGFLGQVGSRNSDHTDVPPMTTFIVSYTTSRDTIPEGACMSIAALWDGV
jgi:hypothetical protein